MVEAGLCGPVVATDVARHAEIMQDRITGLLADAPGPNWHGSYRRALLG